MRIEYWYESWGFQTHAKATCGAGWVGGEGAGDQGEVLEIEVSCGSPRDLRSLLNLYLAIPVVMKYICQGGKMYFT